MVIFPENAAGFWARYVGEEAEGRDCVSILEAPSPQSTRYGQYKSNYLSIWKEQLGILKTKLYF